jgi:hypothetical protein
MRRSIHRLSRASRIQTVVIFTKNVARVLRISTIRTGIVLNKRSRKLSLSSNNYTINLISKTTMYTSRNRLVFIIGIKLQQRRCGVYIVNEHQSISSKYLSISSLGHPNPCHWNRHHYQSPGHHLQHKTTPRISISIPGSDARRDSALSTLRYRSLQSQALLSLSSSA